MKSNDEMIDQLKKRQILKDEKVEKAMRKVDRKKFVPEKFSESAYSDKPLPIGEDQTISAPHMVAIMTQKLELEKYHQVLEIGAGSGYQAAVLGEITTEGQIHTIELVEELAKKASERLSRYENLQVHSGNGYNGYEAGAPYDRILVACAAEKIPPPLKKQLKKGGSMVLPLGGRLSQRLTRVKKVSGEVKQEDLGCPCRFVPLILP